MDKVGIRLIVTDSIENVNYTSKRLDVSDVIYPLSTLAERANTASDDIFFVVVKDKEEAKELLKYLTVRCGVLYFNGFNELVGWNLDWTKKILNVAVKDRDYINSWVSDREKEDPFEELGYHRK